MKNRISLFLRKIRSAPMRQAAPLMVLAALILLPVVSAAVDLTGTSSTYLAARKTGGGSNTLPLYEYLNMSVSDGGRDTVSLQFGGWARYDLRDDAFGTKGNNDLTYAYLSYQSAESNARINLGRIAVFEGIAADRLDGIYAGTDLRGNFGISVFGGVPAETGINFPGNNVIYGGRLSHEKPGLYRIGVSGLKEDKNSEDFRKEEGVDLWLTPVNNIELLGKSNYNSITHDWFEHSYLLVLRPVDKLRLNTTASWINYRDYFSRSTTPVFSFQPGLIDPNENVRIIGEEASYGLTDRLSISADYKAFLYHIAGNANYYGINIGYTLPASGAVGFSFHRMDGDTASLRYYEYRAYGSRKVDGIDVALDLIYVMYDAAINGRRESGSASLAALYDLSSRLKVGADVEYQRNPDFDKDVRAFLKAVYRFDAGYGRRKGA